MIHLRKFENFDKMISENLRYHIDNEISILENIFRFNSEAYFDILEETRNLYTKGCIELTDLDKELFETTDIGLFAEYNGRKVALDMPFEEELINEKEEKHPKLNSPTRSSGPKKYKVYVRNPKTGNIKKINFGDLKGGLSTKINDPKARKSFVARHKCHLKNDKMTAGYWACRIPRYKSIYSGSYTGFW
jgi:hypothetical protein